MKRTSLIAAAALIAVASTAVLATAHDRDSGREHRGPGNGMMFERFDINADGQVTRAEIEAAAADRFAQADTDGDGQLTADEMVAAAEARRAARMADRVARMIERHDSNDDGTLSLAELAPEDGMDRLNRLFDMIDADDDGVITKAEAEAMLAMRGHGRHGRHGGHGDHDRN